MKKISTAISRLFEANRAGIALLLMGRRLWRRIASSVIAFQLRAPGLQLGPGCRIIGGRHISFGKDIFAERNLWLEAVTAFGSQRFHPEITIGDNVCFSDSVHISSIASIAENVWVGDNSVIVGPATIGRGAIVGANSVVRGVVPANTMVAGAPAKPIKTFNSKTGSWDKV
jgi:acetyltransferase-like isoleucine patch superfamily enzyme